MKMKWYAAGHDFGNSDLEDVFVIKGVEYRRSMPTAFCRVDARAIDNLSATELPPSESGKKGKGGKAKGKSQAVNTQNVQHAKPEFSIIQFEDESLTYAVGNFALTQGKKCWNGRGDHLRYSTKYSVRGLIVNAASVIPDQEFGLYVITGLPADLFIKYLDLRRQIKEALDGVYKFSVDGGTTWRICHVEVDTVLMEGAGALLAYSAQKQLTMTKSTQSACIDIGGGTVDLFAQRGAIPVPEYCKSDRFAVEAAAQLVREIFDAQHPGRGLTDIEIREIMYAYANQSQEYPYPEISVFGTSVTHEELEAIAAEAIDQVANDIVSFVASAWREADGGARFSPLVLVGGGYYYFFEAIKKRIPHIEHLDDMGDFPVYANASGYAFLASKRLAKKEAAEKEKEAALLKEEQEAATQAARNSELLLEEEELHATQQAEDALAQAPN